MYTSMKDVIEGHGISLNQCVALGVDNTNSNMGDHNSMKSRITADNPSAFVIGCICHMLHNSAKKGGKVFQVSISCHVSFPKKRVFIKKVHHVSVSLCCCVACSFLCLDTVIRYRGVLYGHIQPLYKLATKKTRVHGIL